MYLSVSVFESDLLLTLTCQSRPSFLVFLLPIPVSLCIFHLCLSLCRLSASLPNLHTHAHVRPSSRSPRETLWESSCRPHPMTPETVKSRRSRPRPGPDLCPDLDFILIPVALPT